MLQIIYDPSLIKTPIEEVITSYEKEPFIIFSSACYKVDRFWYVPRPALPIYFFGKEEGDCFEVLSKRKDQKKKKFIKIEEDLKVIIDNNRLVNFKGISKFTRIRNKINRFLFTTGEEGFAPYEVEEYWFEEGIRIALFCLYQEEVIDQEKIVEALDRIGKTGFGKDASLGMGRFKIEEVNELNLPEVGEYVYTLSPCLPGEEVKDGWFLPFIRFGKHGGEFAISRNPFKEPVIMADEGAVFLLQEKREIPFIGKGIKGGSKVCSNTLTQGFSIILPVRFVRYEGV
jgi:CRISPR-associated protein Csm4